MSIDGLNGVINFIDENMQLVLWVTQYRPDLQHLSGSAQLSC